MTMDHRFSTLFFSPPSPPISSSEATMSGALPDPKALGKKNKSSMKHLLRKLFGIPRQKADPLIKTKSIESGPSELSRQVWSEFVSVSRVSSKGEKKASGILRSLAPSSSTVVVSPTIQTTQGTRRKDIFHKSTSSMIPSITNKKRSSTYSSTRDSKFSSISSLPSLAAPSLHPHAHTQSRTSSPGPSISLSVKELATLQSLIRRVERQLKKQEYLTNHLAGNLVHLFGKKEVQIRCMKRCRVQDREMAGREIFRVKENIGRGFLRRGVLVGRCEGALNLLRTALDNATRAPSTPRSNRRSSSSSHPSSSSSRTSSPSSYITATSTLSNTSNSNAQPLPRTNPTFTLHLSTLNDTIYTLSSSLSLHSVLNADLKSQIYSACLKSRWNGLPGGGMNGNPKGNVNDRIMMTRFVSFVESRVGLLDECEVKLEELVGRIEGLGKRRSVS